MPGTRAATLGCPYEDFGAEGEDGGTGAVPVLLILFRPGADLLPPHGARK